MSMLAVRIYASDRGEGRARLTREFQAASALYRADVLQDAIRQLQELYAQAVPQIFPESKAAAE